MTIAIGRVVDDSIVVIENIKRHLSYGEGKRDAITTAVREVAGAITASTIATAAVFVPIGLVGGMVGELFRPFAFTTAIALVASLLVSLTIVPGPRVLVRQGRRLGRRGRRGGPARRRRGQGAPRPGCSGRTWPRCAVPSRTRSSRCSPPSSSSPGRSAWPPAWRPTSSATRARTPSRSPRRSPPATSLEAQDAAAQEIEEVLLGVEGVQTVQTTVGSAGGIEAVFGGGGAPRASFALTLDHGLRQRRGRPTTCARPSPTSPAPRGTGTSSWRRADAAFGSSTVDVVVQADDPDELASLAAQVRDVVAGVEGTTDVTNDLAADQPTVRVTVDREAAAAAGLTETAVVGTVAGLMSPQPVGTVDLGTGPVDVTVVTVPAPASVAEVEQLVLPTATGLVPLTSVASVEQVEVPVSTTRIDGKRARDDLGDARRPGPRSASPSGCARRSRTSTCLPVRASRSAASRRTRRTRSRTSGSRCSSRSSIVYVVMVATFRSLLQPLILMVSVPFAATGALLGLLLTGTPLGVPALIGVLMLIGVVVTNAIVLVDLVNQYRDRGRGPRRRGDGGVAQAPAADPHDGGGDDLRAGAHGLRPDRRRGVHLAAAGDRRDRRAVHVHAAHAACSCRCCTRWSSGPGCAVRRGARHGRRRGGGHARV